MKCFFYWELCKTFCELKSRLSVMILDLLASCKCKCNVGFSSRWINLIRVLVHQWNSTKGSEPFTKTRPQNRELLIRLDEYAKGSAGKQHSACLANKAASCSSPLKQRSIFFSGPSSEQQAYALSLTISCLLHFLPACSYHSSSVSNVGISARSFIRSAPPSLTHQQHHWLSLVENASLLRNSDCAGVQVLHSLSKRGATVQP